MLTTIANLIDQYETSAKLRGVKSAQLRALIPVRRAFGACVPMALRPNFVLSYVQERRQGMWSNARGTRPASDSTIRRELGALTAVLNWAAGACLIKRDEVPKIDLPPPGQPRERFLTKDEADALWLWAEREVRTQEPHAEVGLFTCLALDTWARANAIETLTWDRVDFNARQIDYRDLSTHATKKRRMAVPVSDRLFAVLCVARDWAVRENRFLANAEVVGPITQYAWQGWLRHVGLSDLTRHDLRRTGISLAMAAGKDPMKVATMAGDDLATIIKHYARFAPDYLKDVVAA